MADARGPKNMRRPAAAIGALEAPFFFLGSFLGSFFEVLLARRAGMHYNNGGFANRVAEIRGSSTKKENIFSRKYF
jgi:hypothetical protein